MELAHDDDTHKASNNSSSAQWPHAPQHSKKMLSQIARGEVTPQNGLGRRTHYTHRKTSPKVTQESENKVIAIFLERNASGDPSGRKQAHASWASPKLRITSKCFYIFCKFGGSLASALQKRATADPRNNPSSRVKQQVLPENRRTWGTHTER